MRSVLALAAAGLALIAAAASAVSGEDDVIAFFLLLALVAGVIAALARSWTGRRRLLARALAIAWLVGAIWIGALLVWYQASCACSMAAPIGPAPNVAGIPTTFFHVLATYLGGALVVVATFSGRLAVREAERR